VGLHFSKHASEAPDTPDSAGSFQGACCQVGEFVGKTNKMSKLYVLKKKNPRFSTKKDRIFLELENKVTEIR